MRRAVRVWAALAGCLLAIGPSLSSAQVSTYISSPFSFSSVNQQVTLALGGQSTCSVVVNSVGGGATLVASTSTDGATFNPTSIGGSGITAVGTFVGNIYSTGIGSFRLQATALTSGTASGTIACSASNAVNQAGANQFIAAGVTTATTIRTGPGRLFGITCTTAGTNASVMNVTDGTSNVLAVIPASCPLGTVVSIPIGGIPNVTSIVVNGQANAPALTITYL